MTASRRLIPVPESDLHRLNFRVGEAAWLLRFSYQRVLEMIHSGEIAAQRVGPRIFVVPRSEVERVQSGVVLGGAA